MQKNRKNIVSLFVQQLWEIIEDQTQNYDTVRWNQTGHSFVISCKEQFSIKILAKYFNNNSKFTSFVRQLNMYNFKKIRNTHNKFQWSHDLFRKNHKELLIGIKRKPTEIDLEQAKKLLERLSDQSVKNQDSSYFIQTPASPSKNLKNIFAHTEENHEINFISSNIEVSVLHKHYNWLWNEYCKVTKKLNQSNQKVQKLFLSFFMNQQPITSYNFQFQNFLEHLQMDDSPLKSLEDYMRFYIPSVLVPQPYRWILPINQRSEYQIRSEFFKC